MSQLLVSGGSDFKACRDSEIQEINVHFQPNKVCCFPVQILCIHLAPGSVPLLSPFCVSDVIRSHLQHKQFILPWLPMCSWEIGAGIFSCLEYNCIFSWSVYRQKYFNPFSLAHSLSREKHQFVVMLLWSPVCVLHQALFVTVVFSFSDSVPSVLCHLVALRQVFWWPVAAGKTSCCPLAGLLSSSLGFCPACY